MVYEGIGRALGLLPRVFPEAPRLRLSYRARVAIGRAVANGLVGNKARRDRWIRQRMRKAAQPSHDP